MNNENLLGYTLLIFIFFIIMIYFKSDIFQLKCIVSTVDGNKYCVLKEKICKSCEFIS